MFTIVYCSSGWFVVFLSVERLIIVCFPLKVKVLSSRKKSIVAAIILPLVMGAVFWYQLVAYEMDENGRCNMKEKYEFLIGQVYHCTFNYIVVSVVILCDMICFENSFSNVQHFSISYTHGLLFLIHQT